MAVKKESRDLRATGAADQVDNAIADFKSTLATADSQLTELRKLRHNLSAVIEEGEQRLSSLAANAPRPSAQGRL